MINKLFLNRLCSDFESFSCKPNQKVPSLKVMTAKCVISQKIIIEFWPRTPCSSIHLSFKSFPRKRSISRFKQNILFFPWHSDRSHLRHSFSAPSLPCCAPRDGGPIRTSPRPLRRGLGGRADGNDYHQRVSRNVRAAPGSIRFQLPALLWARQGRRPLPRLLLGRILQRGMQGRGKENISQVSLVCLLEYMVFHFQKPLRSLT
jgi:hypothetical protein